MNDSFWSDYFDELRSSPNSWFSWSARLKRAADILWISICPSLSKIPQKDLIIKDFYNIELMPIYLMLTGLSFELLIKAMDIQRNKSKVKKELLNTHGVTSIVSEFIPLSIEERELLNRLELHVVWGGRYPIPKKKENFIPVEVRKKGGVFPGFSVKDKNAIEKLYTKLYNLVGKQ
ncbi:hypothetical protein C4564_05580 [Candidatus Microgenomates bacterium]|nr:MAG: hypothetical protein C4564_05580 [Candidatus Microgenomates bacterium]